MWIKADRSRMQDDPVVFAAKDPVTFLTIVLAVIMMALAANPIRLP